MDRRRISTKRGEKSTLPSSLVQAFQCGSACRGGSSSGCSMRVQRKVALLRNRLGDLLVQEVSVPCSCQRVSVSMMQYAFMIATLEAQLEATSDVVAEHEFPDVTRFLHFSSLSIHKRSTRLGVSW